MVERPGAIGVGQPDRVAGLRAVDSRDGRPILWPHSGLVAPASDPAPDAADPTDPTTDPAADAGDAAAHLEPAGGPLVPAGGLPAELSRSGALLAQEIVTARMLGQIGLEAETILGHILSG